MTRFLPHLEISIEADDASWFGEVARLEEGGLSFVLDRGLKRGVPLSFRLRDVRGNGPVEGNLRVVGEAVATYGRRFRANFVDLDDDQRRCLSALLAPDADSGDDLLLDDGMLDDGMLDDGMSDDGMLDEESQLTDVIMLERTPPTGHDPVRVPELTDSDILTAEPTRTCEVGRDAISQATAFTQCSVSAPMPLPLAGREAIRAALRRSIAEKGWSRRRSDARSSRLRLALGRGEVALASGKKGG